MNKHFETAINYLKQNHDEVNVVNVVHDYDGNEVGFMLKIPYNTPGHIRQDGTLFKAAFPDEASFVDIGQYDDSEYAYVLKHNVDHDGVDWKDTGFYD